MTETNVDVSPDTRDRARERARSAIAHLVRDTAGEDAFHEVPIMPGGRTTEHRPEPLQGLHAALRVRDAATAHARRFVEELRGDGASWQTITAAVRRDDDVDNEDEQIVFEEFAAPGLSPVNATWLSWRCSTCGERVTDHGPYNGHPDDVEDGHLEDCARHAADVRAYDQQDR